MKIQPAAKQRRKRLKTPSWLPILLCLLVLFCLLSLSLGCLQQNSKSHHRYRDLEPKEDEKDKKKEPKKHKHHLHRNRRGRRRGRKKKKEKGAKKVGGKKMHSRHEKCKKGN